MKIIGSLFSDDKETVKYLQKAKDNHIIETGYYNLDEHIICISSQIGCPMNCIFCATTAPIDSLMSSNKVFIRNLSSREIVQQVKNILQLIDKNKLNSKRILFSYMGMGEPLLNYNNLVKSIKILNQQFPSSRTTVSTLGIKPRFMRKLAQEKINTILKLHLSLHAPNNRLRKKILPSTKEIIPALKALNYFSSKRNILLKVNYILIKNFNDSKKQAINLAKLLQPYPFIVKLSNLNSFNCLEPCSLDKFDMFEKTLNSHGIKTCRFFSDGTDIQAGCGQLRRRFYNTK